MKRATVFGFIEFGIQMICIGVGFVAVCYWLATSVLGPDTKRGEYVQRDRHEAYMKLQGHTGLIRNSDDARNQIRQLNFLSKDPRWR